MSDRPASRDYSYVAASVIPEAPPPPGVSGPVHWIRTNLFATPLDAVMTLAGIAFLIWAVPGFLSWAFFDAVFEANSLSHCREIARAAGVEGGFACWAVINERFNQFMFGFYPPDQYWRPILAFVLLWVALAPVLFNALPRKMLWFSAAYPIVAYFLIWGGAFGLTSVASRQLGGFTLALILGVTGIAASLPLGILLALGRQSKLFIVKTICVTFIEFIRGVPLITLLFVASVLLNYFLPPGTTFDLILRVVIMVTLFASAYMAEVIRGGLAALPQGQYEAADSLGLDYWKSMRLIILPQALKISIPGIVNTFIGLFKDTTLVSVIGLLDPVGIIAPMRADSAWNGIVWEFYGFVGAIFFMFCFGMSRYSMYLERKLATDRR